jgi:hypothetical protein
MVFYPYWENIDWILEGPVSFLSGKGQTTKVATISGAFGVR